MNISKIGAKVVESYFNVFIGKGTQKMFINAEFRCAKENLLTQYKSVSVICHNTDKFWRSLIRSNDVSHRYGVTA